MTTAATQEQRPDWRSLPMVEQMQHMLQTGELSDCSFLVGKHGEQSETIVAHKLLLCRASEVFNVMFTGPMQEKGEIRVDDISPGDFKAMLKYIYTEQLDLSDLDMSLHVLMAANKYLIMPLCNKCVQFAIEKMQAGDVCKVLYFANLVEHQQLKQASLKMLQEKTEEVINVSTWVDTPSSFVLTVVQQDSLNVCSELSLLTACHRWSQHHISTSQSTRDLLAQFLPHLRLRTLTTEQFTKFTVIENSVFTEKEIVQILQSIVAPELSMPSGVCDLTVPRTATQLSSVPVNPGNEKDLMSNILQFMENVEVQCLNLIPSSNVPLPLVLSSKRHMLLCGVLYSPIQTSDVDALVRFGNGNKYLLSLTVKLIDIKTNARVIVLKYEETVNYGSCNKHLCFPQPYLLKKNTQVKVKVTYNTEIKGKHRLFVLMNSDKAGDYLYPGSVTGLPGISVVSYKIVQ